MKRKLFMIVGMLTFIVVGLFPAIDRMIGNSLFLPFIEGNAFAQEKGTAKVVFKVKCYDEGKAALQGLKGIKKIETGFHYIHETDTVYFDPMMITVEEMETALKKAGTYVETIEQKEGK